MKDLTLRFEYERDTKNKVRLSEVGSDTIGKLYVDKAVYADLGSPSVVVVRLAGEGKS